jgi:hypothetical protein
MIPSHDAILFSLRPVCVHHKSCLADLRGVWSGSLRRLLTYLLMAVLMTQHPTSAAWDITILAGCGFWPLRGFRGLWSGVYESALSCLSQWHHQWPSPTSVAGDIVVFVLFNFLIFFSFVSKSYLTSGQYYKASIFPDVLPFSFLLCRSSPISMSPIFLHLIHCNE